GPSELVALGLHRHPLVVRYWPAVSAAAADAGAVIEAVHPLVAIHSLEHSLRADHVAILRPQLAAGDLASALVEAFGHVGKAYDYEFNFNVTSRIVCTELIYRCFHRRGRCRFELVRRFRRFTLSGDDIAAQFLRARSGQPGAGLNGFSLQG